MIKFLKSYTTIIKEASLFSGVQIVLLLVSMIRNMIIAKYLGVEATGIVGVLQNITGLFIAIFSVGLPVLLVRSFALKQTIEIQIQQHIIKRTIIFLGIVGSVLFYFLVPLFSNELFSHDGYDWILKVTAIVILLKQLSIINISALQGKQHLNLLAKVNIISSILSLIIAIPLYYYFKLEGVVFGFIAMYLIEVAVSFLSFKRNKIDVFTTPKNYSNIIKEGVVIGYGNVLTLLAQFLVIYYVTSQAGNIQAGFYTAGFSIINNYVALIFVAMSTGYLPRIIKLLDNRNRLQTEMTKQLNFSLAVIGVLSIVCILFASFIVNFLFSDSFEIVVPFLRVAIFGIIFKSVSWCLGYLIIAKVDKKVLMCTGGIFNILFTVMLIYGFYVKGIIGVAYAFVIYNFLHFISVSLIVRFRYFVKIETTTILFLIVILFFNALLLLLL